MAACWSSGIAEMSMPSHPQDPAGEWWVRSRANRAAKPRPVVSTKTKLETAEDLKAVAEQEAKRRLELEEERRRAEQRVSELERKMQEQREAAEKEAQEKVRGLGAKCLGGVCGRGAGAGRST